MNNFVTCIVVLLAISAPPPSIGAENSATQWRHHEKGGCRGDKDGQCSTDEQGRCGKKKGDCYGNRKPVTSKEDAEKRFVEYFAPDRVTISAIIERPHYFEAEITGSDGKKRGNMIIIKRSGRIRSTF